ncbi:hypothetical protein [Hahella sp. HN01]|uniref:hypothetical protein n=1 Tax=Hahella sp. HN01 TaxID=2847262 RepID=UPI001C1E92C6|nr:hypothetical protein [Hahella sp. HN01]
MNSIRERIQRTCLDTLKKALAPVPVWRYPTAPINREASPALLLMTESDVVLARVNDRVERALSIRLVAITRGRDAFEQADRLAVAAHTALMRDANVGGLAYALLEIDAEWDAEDADAGAVALPLRYEVRYRTHIHDLTRDGSVL